MQHLELEVKGSALRVYDHANKGTLIITFKPMGKSEISPLFEAWNDIETAIASGKLKLSLFGYNTIKERRGFVLEGEVVLSSTHLYDPTVINSRLHLVSLKARSYIKDSELTFVGVPHFGRVMFNECQFNSLPNRVSQQYTSYYRNEPMGFNQNAELL